MSAPPTHEHLQRAFDLLRRPGWPHDLDSLLAAQRHAALVQGLAQRLANGQGMTLPARPGELADQPAPPPTVPLRAWDYPPRLVGARTTYSPARRSSDGPDLKSLAAGERADD